MRPRRILTSSMRYRNGTTARAFAFALVAAVFGAAALLLSRDDWNWAKPALRWAVGRFAGRAFEIRGDLRVDLGLHTEVTAADVHLGNVAWAAASEMFSARRLSLRLRPLPLLAGRLRLERLEVDGARLELEKRIDGENNWRLRRGRGATGAVDLPGTIVVRDSDLAVADAARPRGFALHVDAVETRTFGALRVVAGAGVYQGEAFRLRAGLFGRPASEAGRTRVAIRARVGGTSAIADGWIGASSGDPLFEVDLTARGRSLDDLWRLSGFPLPHSPPFRLAGKLSYDAGLVRLARLAGRLGHSDLAGDLGIALPRGARMQIDADLRSRAVDLDDVEGFWGRPPQEESKTGATPTPGTAASIFPDLRFELSKLRVADARIRFVADRIQGRTVLDHVRLAATLADGTLELQPLTLGMSAGVLTTTATLDARADEPRLVAALELRRVRLADLLARAGVPEGAGGELGGRAQLITHGRSLAELARHADGELGVVLQGGWISDPLLELLALHLGGYIRARLDKDEPGPIRCLVGLFEARQGVLETQSLLLDTSHVRIEGEGTIDLARERLDLELEQHSKHFTVGALRTPIEIVGPLQSRTARLKAGPLAVRGGAAAALASAVHPLAALLLLVDPGSDDKPAACSEALAEFRAIAPRAPEAAVRDAKIPR